MQRLPLSERTLAPWKHPRGYSLNHTSALGSFKSRLSDGGRKRIKKQLSLGRVGGRLKREGIRGYVYTYSSFTLSYSRN